MKYRQLRKADTGQWLNVLFTVNGDQFAVAAETHQVAIAAALGLAPTELEVVDSDMDIRVGPLFNLPTAMIPVDPGIAAFAAGTVAQKLDMLAKRAGLA